jgi:6-pyruvoyltetrahydropterin/6-carboxytetrahydropterin synthase
MALYRVRVTKDHLVFAAAHFITIGDDCERIHGHNWRVAVDVAGPLDENQYVVDFLALRDGLQAIVAELDHSMLTPLHHPTLNVTLGESEVEIRHGRRRWVFPKEECRLLPIQQTTAELLAGWIGRRLLERLGPAAARLTELVISVEENFGQWASCDVLESGTTAAPCTPRK